MLNIIICIKDFYLVQIINIKKVVTIKTLIPPIGLQELQIMLSGPKKQIAQHYLKQILQQAKQGVNLRNLKLKTE